MSETSDETEPLPDPSSAEDVEEPAGSGDFTELLRSFEGDSDLDDSVSEELDAGVALEDDELPVGDEAGPLLDIGIGEMVQSREDDDAPGADDLGPAGEPAFAFFEENGTGETEDDDAEGAVEREGLITEDLPSIDADAADDEGTLTDESDELLGAGEEEPPRHAEVRWLDLPPLDTTEFRVVRYSKGHLVAGRNRLVDFQDDAAPLVLAAHVAEPLHALLLDGDGGLFSTESGQLFRFTQDGAPEELTAFRTVYPLGRGDSPRVELGGPTLSGRPAILVHLDGAALLESTDRGTTFRRVELGGPVHNLSTGVPAVCIVELPEGPRLFRSEASGGFRKIGADLDVDTAATTLASDGDVVALLERGAGVKVSADGGATLRRVAGTARTTAITTGRLGGRPSAFAALFDAASGHTSIVWIDAASADAHIVAELSLGPDQEDDFDDWTRVVSLTWDAAGETLWAAGAFGLRGFRRPPSA